MFIISNINSGFISSLKKLDKPIIKINKLINRTSVAQNSANILSNSYLNVKDAINSSANTPCLKPINSFLKSVFSKPTHVNKYLDIEGYSKLYSNTSSATNFDSISSKNINTNKLRLENNSKLVNCQPANKVDYRYDNIASNLHNTSYFKSVNNDFRLDFLLANFFNSKNSIKFQEALKNSSVLNLNEKGKLLDNKQLFNILDDTQENTIVVENTALINNDFALNLAKNRQRLLVSNSRSFYVFIPRLELNTSTKSLEVYWHYVDENSNLVDDYLNLDKNKQSLYLKNNITKSLYKHMHNLSKKVFNIRDEIEFLHQQNQKYKTDIADLKNEYKLHNNENNIAFSRSLIDLENNIKDNNQKISDLKHDYNNLRNEYNSKLSNYSTFSQNLVNIIDIISEHKIDIGKLNKNSLHSLFSELNITNIKHEAIEYAANFLLDLDKSHNNFTLQELLGLIKNRDEGLTLLANQPTSKGPVHELLNLAKPKTNSSTLQNRLQGRFNQKSNELNKYKSDNKNVKDLIYAVGRIYGKTSQQFIQNNPATAAKLLDKTSNANLSLINILGTTNEHNGEVYNLNTVFKYKDVIDHSAQKNGKSIIDNVLQKNIDNHKPLLIYLSGKLLNKYSNQILIEYNSKQNLWEVNDLKNKSIITTFDDSKDIIGYLEHLTKQYNVDAYLQINHNKTRAEFRFKGYRPIGTSTNELFNKLLKHHHTWNDDVIVDKKSNFFQLKDKYSLAPANLASSNTNFADKNIKQYSRAEQALIYKWHTHEIRGNTIKYKQEDKPLRNPVTRLATAYLNPFSYENRQGWKSGRYERLAKMNREDRVKRVVGNAVENGWQSIDNWWAFIINSIARGADSEAFKDGTVNWSTHMATCTQSQLMGDALGVTSMHSKSKNSVLSSGLRNTTNDLSRQITNATHKNNADLALFENIYEQVTKDKTTVFSIDGKNYAAVDAQKILQHKLFENMAAFQDLLWQHKAQNKSVVGIAFFKQLFQNLVRMGFMVANGFLLGVSIPLSKLTRLFRMIFQFVGAGADGLLGDEYLLRTSVNMPRHQMTKEAIQYNLDHIIDNLSTEDFESHVIRIMTNYGHTPYTAEQIKALPTVQKKLLLAKFVFSPDLIHKDINYNVDGRVNQGKTYFQETFADYDARFKKYAQEKELAEAQNNIAYQQTIQNKLNILGIKQKDKIEQASLFYRGLAYAERKNAMPAQYVDEEWKHAWQTLSQRYPKSKIVNLLRTDNPFPVIGYAFKNLMKNPMEVLHHTLFRSSFVFWGIDEVGYGLASVTEKNGGDDVAQKIAVAAWYSYVFVSATIGGVASYLEHVANNGRPANHKSNISAFVLELKQITAKFNQQINSLKQTLAQKNIDEKLKTSITLKIQELQNSITPLNKIIELLNNDINPQASIKNISDADELLLTAFDKEKNQHIVEYKKINKNVLEQYTSELLSTSVASILPNKSQHDKKQTDKNWIENIQKNVDFWVKGESIASYPINKIQKLFKSKDKQQQELNASLDKAKQQLLIYTQDIFNKYQGNYLQALNYLFAQTAHEVNKSLFIQQIIDIQTQTSNEVFVLNDLIKNLEQEVIKINNKPLKNNLDKKMLNELNNQLNLIKIKLDNFKHLELDLTTFLKDKHDKILSREKYIDISNNSEHKLFEEHNNLNSKGLNKTTNPLNIISFKLSNTLNFNNRRLDENLEIADTTVKKIKLGSKRTGKFLYERILNPFGRKSFSKYLINPSYRHWLPYMLLRQAAILPVKLVEFSILSSKSGSLSYSLQKTSNNSGFRNITKNNINNLDKEIIEQDKKIQQLYINIQTNYSNLSLRNKAKQEYQALHQQKQQLAEEKEKIITYGYQVWRTNDKLKHKLINKSTGFESTVQSNILERKSIIAKHF